MSRGGPPNGSGCTVRQWTGRAQLTADSMEQGPSGRGCIPPGPSVGSGAGRDPVTAAGNTYGPAPSLAAGLCSSGCVAKVRLSYLIMQPLRRRKR